MSLNDLSAQISKVTGEKKRALPPVEDWDPDYCGEIDLQIKSNGDWYYAGTIFKRHSLVKLLASVLIYEESDEGVFEYFLITPVEKIKITVEDVPFMLTKWHWLDAEHTQMEVSTNLDDSFMLDKAHPLTIDKEGNLYVVVRRNLLAKVHRNVFYQWVELAKEKQTIQGTELVFTSAMCEYSLGFL